MLGGYQNQETQALGQQTGYQNALTDHQALSQQWRDRADDQYRFAQQAKCQDAYQDHMDNALRFDEWAQKWNAASAGANSIPLMDELHEPDPEMPEPIDYFSITREVSA